MPMLPPTFEEFAARKQAEENIAQRKLREIAKAVAKELLPEIRRIVREELGRSEVCCDEPEAKTKHPTGITLARAEYTDDKYIASGTYEVHEGNVFFCVECSCGNEFSANDLVRDGGSFLGANAVDDGAVRCSCPHCSEKYTIVLSGWGEMNPWERGDYWHPSEADLNMNSNVGDAIDKMIEWATAQLSFAVMKKENFPNWRSRSYNKLYIAHIAITAERKRAAKHDA